MNAYARATVGTTLSADTKLPRGDYRCRDCGYAVSVVRELPRCPMCGGADWAPSARILLRSTSAEFETAPVVPARRIAR
jgi:hypothetical protein